MHNGPALLSAFLGLLAAAAIPAAVLYVDRTAGLELIWAGVAVPAALVLGLAAIAAGRAGQRRAQMTLLRRSGSATATIGRLLGTVALLLAGTGTVTLLVYAVLTYRGRA